MRKKKLSKKEAEEIRLLTIELIEKARLRDIFIMVAYQTIGRKFLVSYLQSTYKCPQKIIGWVLVKLTKLYSFYFQV